MSTSLLRSLRAGRPVVLLALSAAVPAASARAQAEHHVLGGDAAVYNLAGSVRVVAGTGSDVAVDVERHGRDAGKLRVETGDVRGHRAVRVVYPDDDIIYPAIGHSRVRVRANADGTFGDDHSGGFFSSHEIDIRSSGSGTEAWADMTIAVPAGRRLILHLAAGDATLTNVDGDLTIDVHAATVTAERTKGSLMVDAGSGRVRVTGAQGDVNLDLGSGGVELRDIAATRLRVDGGSGDVNGANIDARTVDLDLGSGSTRLGKLTTHDLTLDSGSGSVDLEFATDVDDVRIDSGSGSVTLRVPPSLGASLDVDTGSGGIDTEVPIQVTRRERDHLTGSIGDGKGRIVIDGGSGKVRILKS
jgi:lia operon protein LiaG